MKKIIVFRKYGRLRFVGHLDMMRVFQRALRRAEVPLAYSQGFNPHPLMSFGNPLALGCTGEREVMEIILEQEQSDDQVKQSLQQQLPDGLDVVACFTSPSTKTTSMAAVKGASYEIELPAVRNWADILPAFLAQETISVMKLGKVYGRKKQVAVDIKPWIYECVLRDDGKMQLLCACGSEENLKPELLVLALYEYAGCPEEQYNEHICRLSLLGRKDERFIALESVEGL